MITNIVSFVLIYYLTNLINNVQCVPSQVCVIGDVQSKYESQRDPRSLMGTYTISIISNTSILDDEVVDVDSPIYEHHLYGNLTKSESEPIQYLFKVKTVGWALSETLPVKGTTITVFLTCFKEDLFECKENRWYWGYDKYDYPIGPLKVLGGPCNS